MGGFEYIREIARKPYVLYGYMYSNGISPSQAAGLKKTGVLSVAKWTRIKEVNPADPVPAGEEIFRLECSSCHTLNGYNAISSKIRSMTERGIEAQLTGQGSVRTYMPPFFGNELEKKALAAYLNKSINGREPYQLSDYDPPAETHTVPSFNAGRDEYVLLVWNDLGMHCLSDNDKYFVFLPPANTLNAQLFKRGDKPRIITSGVKLVYEVEEPYRNPEKHVRFWDYAEKNFGVKLETGVGLAGKRVVGEFDIKGNHFAADLIPVTPYRDNLPFNPYPLFTVKAIEEKSGRVLMETKAVAPNSTEMGCRNCHGGSWRVDNVSGVSDETAMNILAIHDKNEKTTLLADASAGNPRLCQSCHEDPALGAAGKSNVLNFSSAMHGFHANYMKGLDDNACNLCHPSRPKGNTACMRGRHTDVGVTCVECHGKIEDHALALLKNEKNRGKKPADRLMANLSPTAVDTIGKINPRMPWITEPDCKSCHTNFDIAKDGWEGGAYNQWVPGFDALYRNRADNQGVMCIACHGSTHAIYPAVNKYDKDRDNIQSIQYQGVAGTIGTRKNCKVCHIKKMTTNGHHRNMVK
ncbi:MAG: cytochrome c [Syntrophales bacterium]